MLAYILLFLIPLLVAAGFFVAFKHKVTWQEFLTQSAIVIVLSVSSMAVTKCSNTADVELWGGKIAKKVRDKVSCSHSYQCNCRTQCSGSGKNRSCWTVCDTCYEHSYDVDWDLYTTNREYINIRRIDRQGLQEPPRWTKAQIGDPTMVAHGFTNYIKGAPETLFRQTGLVEKYKGKLPAYPGKVYDYHYVNRLVTVRYSVPDAKQWNADLMNLNAEVGKEKQVSLGVVLVGHYSEEYFHALRQHWLGGKKNDSFLVIGVMKDGTIDWVNVISWAKFDIYRAELIDAIHKIGALDREKILAAFRDVTWQNFQRRPMKDFEYLSASVQPTMKQMIFLAIFNLLVAMGVGVLFAKQDIYGTEWRSRWR